MTALECIKDYTPCWHHRYGIVHCLPNDETVYDHSQSTWDEDLRGRDAVETYPSRHYEHGMTATELRRAYHDWHRANATASMTIANVCQSIEAIRRDREA